MYTIPYKHADGTRVDTEVSREKYPLMHDYTQPIAYFDGVLVGKDEAIDALYVIYEDPIISNAILLAPPGTGKTTLMQGLSFQDKRYSYVEVDLLRLINTLHDVSMAGGVIKSLFDEIKQFIEESGIPLVIFIDEVHDVVQLSKSAVEAIKPVLANSAAWGLRVVAATTYEEFRLHISDNLALVERFQRVSLQRPDEEGVVKALISLAEKSNVTIDGTLIKLMHRVYDVTEKFMPANNQPRKSLYTFSKMIAMHKVLGDPLDEETLAKVLRLQNIEINQQVDLDEMGRYIRSRVLSQEAAVRSFIDSVAVSVMKLNEEDEPRGSWLMSGPTGVGKALADYESIPAVKDGYTGFIKHGELAPGDRVLNRRGEWVFIKSVHPQGERDVYRLKTVDGRSVDCSKDHLWTVIDKAGVQRTLETGELMNNMIVYEEEYSIPATQNRPYNIDGYRHGDAQYNWVKIERIEATGDVVNMQCIYIDDHEHLYMTESGLMTHNTELVKAAAKFLFNDPNAFVRFDMTEYSQPESIERFRRLVTTRVWENPFSIILFDEIEKAHGDVIRILMQVLDDGRLVDQNDRVVNFSNAYIFATTNLGSEIYEEQSQYNTSDDGSGDTNPRSFIRTVKDSIVQTAGEGKFPPELVNRFNNLIPFAPLSRMTLNFILARQAENLIRQVYQQTGVRLNIHKRVLNDYLTKDVLIDDTLSGGGRQVKRVLRDYIKEPLAKYLLEHPNVTDVRMTLEGRTVSDDKFLIDSDARIKIEAI